MQFREENFFDVFHEAFTLLKSHHEEISKFDFELSPDVQKYEKLFSFGMYRVFSARVDKVLVGYAGFFVSPMIHFSKNTQAICDLLYLKPEFRGNGHGRSFIDYLDGALKDLRVDIIHHHIPAKKDWSPMLKEKGYELHDYLYSRRLT